MVQLQPPEKTAAVTPLTATDAHIWIAYPDAVQDPGLISRYIAMLSPDEKLQFGKFRLPQHRHLYLVSRALMRSCLSQYANCPPAKWQFIRNEHGRPEIAFPKTTPRLRFNLSHTIGISVLGVVLRRDIGIDVENTARRISMMKVAKRYFSHREIHDLNSLAEKKRRSRFFQYWTLKESFAKAKGLGLTLPLNTYSFYPSDGGQWYVTVEPTSTDDASRWQFYLYHPPPAYTIALSVQCPPDARYHLKVYETVPLHETVELFSPNQPCEHPVADTES